MSLPKLEIKGGARGGSLDIRLDGEPVPGVRGLQFQSQHDGVNVVQFTIGVGGVEIDAEALAWIKAKVSEDRVKEAV